MKKITMFLMLILISALLLCGCSEPKQEEAMPETVKIGFIGPLTGGNSVEGLAARDAFQMFFEDVNKKHLLPYNVEVISYDDQSIPNKGADVAKSLVSDETILAASAHWNSPVAEATIPVFINEKCPMIIWGAISDSLTNELNYPYITRVVPTDTQENQPLAGYVLGDLGYNKIFIITDTTSYGKSNTDAFILQMASYSARLLGKESVSPETTNYHSYLSKAKESGCDAIFYGGTAQGCGLIADQMQQMGMDDILLFGVSGITSEEFIKTAGAEIAEGTIAISPGIDPEASEKYNKFKEKYEKYSQNKIGTFTVYAYHSAQVMLSALQSIDGTPTREKMTTAIAESKTKGLLGETTFDAIGQTTNPLCYLVVCQDGAWIPYDRSEYAIGIRTLPGR